MFTRIVEITAKSGKGKELIRTVNDKVLTLLKGQPGFVDEITLVSEDNPDQISALSFWKTREDADNYNKATFSRVLEIIKGMIDGAPEVSTFDVVTSTVHNISVTKAA